MGHHSYWYYVRKFGFAWFMGCVVATLMFFFSSACLTWKFYTYDGLLMIGGPLLLGYIFKRLDR